MKEEQMLALLARLCGDIAVANNTDTSKVLQLQESLASAIINEPALTATDSFQFEQLEDFSTLNLEEADLHHLRKVIQRVQRSSPMPDRNFRVFRRETPFVSSQLRGSVAEWARGGKIVETIGPFFNKDGRRFWFDFYRVIPVV